MKYIFFNILGTLIIIFSLMYIISYLNLLDQGYNFSEYVYFISRKVECLSIILGISILLINNKER